MTKEKGFYYLAVPYQGTEEEKKKRTALSLKAATSFLSQGHYLFAPLLYINKIGDEMQLISLEQRRAILMPYLLEFLRVSKGMVLITAEGWEKSWGIYQELAFCAQHSLPLYKLDPEIVERENDFSPFLSAPLSQDQVAILLQNPPC